jgi:uncharacterized protein (DUF1810 family)
VKQKESIMTAVNDPNGQHDPFNLQRFVDAQAKDYAAAFKELSNGKKQTHWMWFVFPQFDGLGYSSTSKLYAIKSKAEARQYLEHPVLGERLLDCVKILLNLEGRSASEIFGYPDNLKLKSSMTLFAYVKGNHSLFGQVLDKYFQSERDTKTLDLLDQRES